MVIVGRVSSYGYEPSIDSRPQVSSRLLAYNASSIVIRILQTVSPAPVIGIVQGGYSIYYGMGVAPLFL